MPLKLKEIKQIRLDLSELELTFYKHQLNGIGLQGHVPIDFKLIVAELNKIKLRGNRLNISELDAIGLNDYELNVAG